MTRFVALLRGINVGGNKKVAMAELRTIAQELGFDAVATYIQSGNLVFEAAGKAALHEQALERAIAKHFGFAVEVLVRDARGWRALVAANPLAQLATADPAHVLVGLAKGKLRKEALAELRERAQGEERLELAADALWIHYAAGIARSKLTPALLDRCVGSTVTARNWRTALELERMLST
jgi:uncharacterized protein (DUF1697 family)